MEVVPIYKLMEADSNVYLHSGVNSFTSIKVSPFITNKDNMIYFQYLFDIKKDEEELLVQLMQFNEPNIEPDGILNYLIGFFIIKVFYWL